MTLSARVISSPLKLLFAENQIRAQGPREFDVHRRRLNELAAACRGARSITVLGAGNCRDWNLQVLSRTFERVTLVDIDSAAIERARSGWPGENLHFVAGVDVLGLLDSPGADAKAAVREAGLRLRSKIVPADVVVSDFVLSDSLRVLRDSGPGVSHWERADVVTEHVRTLLDLTLPHGRAYLLFEEVHDSPMLTRRSSVPPSSSHRLRRPGESGRPKASPGGSSQRPPSPGSRTQDWAEESSIRTSASARPSAGAGGAIPRRDLERVCRVHEDRLRAARLSAWTARFTSLERTAVGGLELLTG